MGRNVFLQAKNKTKINAFSLYSQNFAQYQLIIIHHMSASLNGQNSLYTKCNQILGFCVHLMRVSSLWQKIMSIKPAEVCFHCGFVLSSFKFCNRLCCDWGKHAVLLQTRIHRSAVRKVGAAPPSLRLPTTHPAGEGGLCRQAAAGSRAAGSARSPQRWGGAAGYTEAGKTLLGENIRLHI